VEDLRTSRGTLLMTKGKVLSADQIAQIRRFEIHEDESFVILVERNAAVAARTQAARPDCTVTSNVPGAKYYMAANNNSRARQSVRLPAGRWFQ
jgi:hypothetical protein